MNKLQLSQEIVCLSFFVAKPDAYDELVYALHKLIAPTHQEPGCLQYDLVKDANNPLGLIMVEKFTDQAAFESHVAVPCIKHFIDHDMKRLCDKIEWHNGHMLS